MVPRSEVPAITHAEYSARIQTVHPGTNPRSHNLLDAFEARTGCPVLVNASFNVRGEPIVCTPEDAAPTMGAVISVLFGLVLPWLFGFDFHLSPWTVGGTLALWGLVAPSTLPPLYRAWMKFGMAIGWFNSRVILGLMFYVVILPAGLIMRLAG